MLPFVPHHCFLAGIFVHIDRICEQVGRNSDTSDLVVGFRTSLKEPHVPVYLEVWLLNEQHAIIQHYFMTATAVIL